MSPPKVFISYAHEDRVWCERLQQHLGGLRHQGQLSVWADDQIMAGDEWDPEIRRELDEAAVIVLIVTPAFLGSKFCQTVELTRAMERHGEGSAKVISIIADHCHWTNLPISKLQARPQDENRNLKPLVDWPNANVPLAGIARDSDRATQQTGLSEATVPFVPAPHRTHLQQRRRTFFVGRDAEKRQLMERLAGGGRAAICAVAGMGGVGKTELALQVAGALGEAAFPDGIVTVNLMGTPDAATPLPPLAPDAAMRDVLAQLDPTAQPPTEPAALARAYAQALVGKRLLLILDNARNTAQVTPLVPPEPVALVVTSRHRIDLPEGLTLDLDTLDPADAVALLKEEIGAARQLDDGMLARFAELCGYLPVALLAIDGAIRQSRARTPAQLLDRLEADRAKGLTAALDRLRPSVDALAEDDAALARRFARLAVFAGDFSIEAAAHVVATDEDGACDSLDALLDRSLLLTAVTGTAEAPRFRLHDLIRELATERLGDDLQEGRSRHATFFRNLLAHCDQRYLAGNDAILEALALFDRERAEIVAGQAWAAARAPIDEAAGRLAADYPNAGTYVLDLRLDSRTRILWLEAALNACRSLGDRPVEAYTLGNLGLVWLALGEPRRAIEYHEQDLAFAREIGDRRGEGNALWNMALAHETLNEPEQALEKATTGFVIYRAIEDPNAAKVAAWLREYGVDPDSL